MKRNVSSLFLLIGSNFPKGNVVPFVTTNVDSLLFRNLASLLLSRKNDCSF